jgi:FkbM family methyltransferase
MLEVEACLRKWIKYEPRVTNYISKLRGVLFIDIGAQFGYYSLLVQKNFDRVIAIEPHPGNHRILRKLIRKRGIDNIVTEQIAISEKDGKSFLYLHRHSGGHSLLKRFPYSFSETEPISIQEFKSNYIEVKTLSLSTFLSAEKADLIKLDVEGAEWLALEGARSVMHNMSTWIVELHDLTRKTELERFFYSYDYEVNWLDLNHLCAFR